MPDERIIAAAKPKPERRDQDLTSIPFRFVVALVNAGERDCDSPYFTPFPLQVAISQLIRIEPSYAQASRVLGHF
jgi:hypothetical protein